MKIQPYFEMKLFYICCALSKRRVNKGTRCRCAKNNLISFEYVLDLECGSQSFATIMACPVFVCVCAVYVLVYLYTFIAQIHLAFGILCNTSTYLNWHRAFFGSFFSRTFCTPLFYALMQYSSACACVCVRVEYAQANRMCLCTVNISLHSYSHSYSMRVCIVDRVNKHKH